MGGVGMVVDTAVFNGGGIFTNSRRNEGLTAGVVLDEVGDVMDDSSNGNEGLSVLGVCNEVVPVDNWELLQGNTPIKGSTFLVELLLQLLDTALLNLVLAKLLQVIGKAKLLPDPDGPLRGVILIPLDGISVIRGILVVEVVVALTQGDESGNNVVTGRVSVVEGLLTEPVGEGVDAESGLLEEKGSEDASIDETAEPITPTETSDGGRHDKSH
jgi:hypothetical protein